MCSWLKASRQAFKKKKDENILKSELCILKYLYIIIYYLYVFSSIRNNHVNIKQ